MNKKQQQNILCTLAELSTEVSDYGPRASCLFMGYLVVNSSVFYFILNSNSCLRTVQTLIRRCRLLCLVRVYTVCLGSYYVTLSINGLTQLELKQQTFPSLSVGRVHFQFQGCLVYFFIFILFRIEISEDPNQTPLSFFIWVCAVCLCPKNRTLG